MKLSAPKQGTFCIALILFIVGLVGQFVASIPFVSLNHVWFYVASNVILLIGCAIKGF